MPEIASHAEFHKNKTGQACIALADPAFVQSDTIVLDRDNLHVYAVFHEAAHYLGPIAPAMADSFSQSERVLLSSRRGDGSLFELSAPLATRHGLQYH